MLPVYICRCHGSPPAQPQDTSWGEPLPAWSTALGGKGQMPLAVGVGWQPRGLGSRPRRLASELSCALFQSLSQSVSRRVRVAVAPRVALARGAKKRRRRAGTSLKRKRRKRRRRRKRRKRNYPGKHPWRAWGGTMGCEELGGGDNIGLSSWHHKALPGHPSCWGCTLQHRG